jgi:hypothetical protein
MLAVLLAAGCSPAASPSPVPFAVFAPPESRLLRSGSTETVGGWAQPGATVRCAFSGTGPTEVVVDEDGNWSMTLMVGPRGTSTLACGTGEVTLASFEYEVE